MNLRRLVVAAALIACAGAAHLHAEDPAPIRFDEHRVVRVDVQTKQQLERLLSLTDDVWSHHLRLGPIDVRVSPAQYDRLRQSGLACRVLIPDVQALIDREADRPRGVGFFDDYHTYADVVAYMNSLVALRPDLAQTFVLGQTLELRDIVGIRITGPGGGTKPGALFHGCEHAREWVSVPVTLYVADQLIRNYDTDPYIQELVDRIEFYVVPVFNVDGYLYTWSSNRLWRKNRRNNGDGSFGVDINRNWGYQWGGAGASPTPSNDTYRGPSPFSEPETQVMRDFILSHPNIRTYNDVHSYSQLLLWPWGYTATLPPDQADFDTIGTGMASRIFAVHGLSYTIGPVYDTIYPASGVSVDWAYGVEGIYAFSFELRDTGADGFLLPASQIIPNAEEILPALLFQADWTTEPLKIDFPSGLPSLLEPAVPNTLDVRVRDFAETALTSSAMIHIRTAPTDPFTPYPLAHLGGSDYEATFPPRACGPDTQFYISIATQQGHTVYEPSDAPAAWYSAPVGTLTVLFSDDFQADLGWTVQNTSLSTGAWTRVDPVGTTNSGQPAQPEDDNPAGTGTFCYVTGQGSPGGTVGAADVDGGPTRLLSPVLALAANPNADISYSRWFYCSGGVLDSLIVEVSNNNGASWSVVETVAPQANAWTTRSFRVADYVAPTDQVRVRFTVADSPNDSLTEAAIDDVIASDQECTIVPVLGDVNCDGLLDSLDATAMAVALTDEIAFQTTYPGCDIMRADIDGNLALDGRDVAPMSALLIGP
ncbi:MAG: hypothetical protein L6Q92_04730 [Phycisphaerae bacterium]|nr:hypothetical protein [Phycisphaerae bacterium]